MSTDRHAKCLDNALRIAWLALRCEYPCIASRVVFDRPVAKYVKEYWNVCPKEWANDTFQPDYTGRSGVELVNDTGGAIVAYMPTMQVCSPPSTRPWTVRRDIVFRALHDIIDGIGTLILLDRYITQVSHILDQGVSLVPTNLDHASIVKNLSAPFAVAAQLPVRCTELVTHRISGIERTDAINSALSDDFTFLGISYKPAEKPGRCKRSELNIGQGATTRIVQAYKARHISISVAFHAAIPVALKMLSTDNYSPNKLLRYSTHLLRNDRPVCTSATGAAHPTGIYHSPSANKAVVELPTHPRDYRQDYLRSLEVLSQLYADERADQEHKLLVPYLFARSMHHLPMSGPEAEAVLPLPPQPLCAAVSLSSLGVIDNIIEPRRGRVQIYNPWVSGDEVRNGYGIFLSSYRGSLSLSAAYNDAFHDEETVQQFLNLINSIVVNNMQ